MSRREKPYAIVTEGTPAVRRLRSTLIAVAAILVLALVWLAASVGSQIDDLKSNLANAGTERAQLRTDLTAQQSALDEANQRLVEAGEKPVTEPPVTGPAGTNGRPPTAREIRDAVTAYCGASGCRGPKGSTVTRSEVAVAVATYCNDRGECRGPRGGDGSDGATGAQGPPPTDAQVAAAVAAFCADGRCRGPIGPVGPAGATGSTGVAGTDGRGIASIDCESIPQLEFTVTFTDGTQRTISCTVIGNQG